MSPAQPIEDRYAALESAIVDIFAAALEQALDDVSTTHGARRRPRGDTTLSRSEAQSLRAFAVHASHKEAAAALGITLTAQQKACQLAYRRLGTTNAVDALRAIGWLTVPAVRPKDPAPLTPAQWSSLAAYARAGDHRLAAHRLRIAPQTQKEHISNALRRLDVEPGTYSSVLAFRALGWLVIPEDPA